MKSNVGETKASNVTNLVAEPDQASVLALDSTPCDSQAYTVLATAVSATLPPVTALGAVTQINLKKYPQDVVTDFKKQLIINQHGIACLAITDGNNNRAVIVGSSACNAAISIEMGNVGVTLNSKNLLELNDMLKAHAEKLGKRMNTWTRVAPVLADGEQVGVEIDLGNDQHTRVRITSGKVELVHKGSDTLFVRSKLSKSLVMPAELGDRKLLNKYLNMHPIAALLFVAWLTYVMAHPKMPTSKYPILLLQGAEGTGKSVLCNQVILALLDPSVIGLQMMPNNLKDLAIASQNSQILAYDNVREIKPFMSDILCVAATGGSMSTRQLYTDSDQQVIHLHVAMVLNGIYSFVTQPDLAQRCLPIQLNTMPELARKSESIMVRELQADLPVILKGLYDLVANIFTHLPNAEVTNPERMIDFVQWLAAMEKADNLPAGVYQAVYSEALSQCRLDALQDNLLASSIMDFAQHHLPKGTWDGSPSELLIDLNKHADIGTQRSKDWPKNPIALSKRIIPLQASLLAQGISVELGRGKNRIITISTKGSAAATSDF